jgi:hypothetical protein
MAAPRLVVELTIEEEDVTKLMAIARPRTDRQAGSSGRACF